METRYIVPLCSYTEVPFSISALQNTEQGEGHNKVSNSIGELKMQETLSPSDVHMAKEWNGYPESGDVHR